MFEKDLECIAALQVCFFHPKYKKHLIFAQKFEYVV